jgi:hypothetical protein
MGDLFECGNQTRRLDLAMISERIRNAKMRVKQIQSEYDQSREQFQVE